MLLLLFILVNVIIASAYRNRTYPNTSIDGQVIGSVEHTALEDRLKKLKLLPEKISLMHDGVATELAVSEIGAGVDHRQISQHIAEQRPWLPIANLLTKPDAPLFVAIKPDVYQKKMTAIGAAYKKAAVNASLTLRDGQFVITPEVDAVSFDASGTQANIVEALQKGRQTGGTKADIATKKVAPAVTRASLTQAISPLQAQRNTAITLTYDTKSKRFSPNEIGSWFVRSGPTYALADDKINAAIADAGLELGVATTNTTEIATIAKRSVENKQTAKLALAGSPVGKKTYSFCTAGRNIAANEVEGLARKATETLNAKRGWSLGGNITFNHVGAIAQTEPAVVPSCDFTLWLSAADQMPTFGAICDSMWSCAVRPNVVINYDRWQNASEAWNKDGGSIEDYRVMVINHEVGHWLGFNHSNCPASGQAAPVMQQQSINLQGCTFNPWPSATERTSLRSYLGL